MPKRKNNEEIIKRYEEKIKKLKKNSDRRRRIIYSDSESDFEQTEEIETNQIADDQTQPEDMASSGTTAPTPIPAEPIPELDPAIHVALGNLGEDSPAYGPSIHNVIAQRWLPLLHRGLNKEEKENLLKLYNIPDNCKLLKSPNLNLEIAAAIADVPRKRDKAMEDKQHQLGLGIAAISRAMTSILDDGEKVEIIKTLSDGCRILTDLHYIDTKTRIKLITPNLGKSFLDIIKNEARDETLFGSSLSEKIKAAKLVERQGLQIKRTTSNQKIPTTKQQPAGNWAPPPRYSSSANRGGRATAYTAGRSTGSFRRKPMAPPQPATFHGKQSTCKPRAPMRQ